MTSDSKLDFGLELTILTANKTKQYYKIGIQSKHIKLTTTKYIKQFQKNMCNKKQFNNENK